MLPLVDGDLRAAKSAAKESLRHVSQYYVDLCTLPQRNFATFESEHLELVNGERLQRLENEGPIVVVSSHTGNAELAIQALTYRGRPFVALVEAQKPAQWAAFLLKLRSSAGGTFHETNFAGIRACLAAHKAGGVAGFMADRDIQGTGICVELAGRTVRLPVGPWEMARRTNATVFPIFSTRIERDRFRVFVEEPIFVVQSDDEKADIREAVEIFARLLEAHLRRDPGQWAVTERFWKAHSCG
jgi:KDO2-lipid IV(A) lauroyltransferase